MSHPKTRKQFRLRKQRKLWPLFISIGIGLMLIFTAILAFNKPRQPAVDIEVKGSPGLKVDKEKVDLGDVKLGQSVKVSFRLTNVGDQTLRFTQTPYIEVLEGC
jgi:HYDIN/CFA65/VesB-like, Ig-like domain